MWFKGSSEEFRQLWGRPISNLTSNKDNRRKLPLKDRGNFSLKSIRRCCLLIQCRLISWGPDKSVLLITPIYLMRLSPLLSKNGKSQGKPVKHQTKSYLTEGFIIRKGLNAPTEISVHIENVWEFYYFIAFWKQRGCQQNPAKRIYKPGGYMYQQVIAFAITHCGCKTSICSWSCTRVQDAQRRQMLSPASGRVWRPTH